eukprot:SM000043S15824  [mRNA]  locus=s43:286144:291803:- [translate_table: standard]
MYHSSEQQVAQSGQQPAPAAKHLVHVPAGDQGDRNNPGVAVPGGDLDGVPAETDHGSEEFEGAVAGDDTKDNDTPEAGDSPGEAQSDETKHGDGEAQEVVTVGTPAGGEASSAAELQTDAKESVATELSTQETESTEEKEAEGAPATNSAQETGVDETEVATDALESHAYPLCSATMTDYIPCLDNEKAIKALPSRHHYEHRERHCPSPEESVRCFVPLPKDYKIKIDWPESRDTIWYSNVPHTKLVSYKKDQNWVQEEGDKLIFPGGGTQFKHGAMNYIDFIEEAYDICAEFYFVKIVTLNHYGQFQTLPEITWGKKVRVALDMGCGVASWGAHLFNKGVITMSIAPKDEHDAQVQFALERGVPALLGVMGTQRLTFPSNSFDLIHCARCRVPWHLEGGMLLVELNRILRPGGYFVWSATPVYKSEQEDTDVWNGQEQKDKEVWEAMKDLTWRMCWTRVAWKNRDDGGVAIWRKSMDNACYEQRAKGTEPPMCATDDNGDAAWYGPATYVPMNVCLHKIPEGESARGTSWPALWRERLLEVPKWLSTVSTGIYGKPAAVEFNQNRKHWASIVNKAYSGKAMGIEWSHVRNVMDMKAGYGGFAAALAKRSMWVMNVVPISSPDTLPIIFDRGLIGVYHDWCEAFNTYPRTYDLLHADHVLSGEAQRCKISDIMLEMDRILRPGGYAIIRDTVEMIVKVKAIAADFHWNQFTPFALYIPPHFHPPSFRKPHNPSPSVLAEMKNALGHLPSQPAEMDGQPLAEQDDLQSVSPPIRVTCTPQSRSYTRC